MRTYGIVVFLSGVAVMVAEIAAARAIAPHFGTSIVVWTNIIGIILTALSLGYWIGGRAAERRPEPRILGCIIAAAGVLLIIPAFATRVMAGTLIVDALRLGSGFTAVVVGSFVTVVVLFALPIGLLGTVSPFAVKLVAGHRSDVGRVAGQLYAISTVGSLVGTFLPTLVLLPLVGTQRTILGAAALLIGLGLALILRPRHGMVAVVIVLVLAFAPERHLPWFLGGTVVAQRDSRYQLLRVVDHRRPGETNDQRVLLFNEGFGIQSYAVRDPAAITGYFAVVAATPAILQPPIRDAQQPGFPASPGSGVRSGTVSDRAGTVSDIRRTSEGGRGASVPGVDARPGEAASRPTSILILGNAGGTIAHLMQRYFLEAPIAITGIELDPEVTALTRTHFPPPPRPYPILHADSRVFIVHDDARYDSIVVDAYTNQLTIPPHLATVEFFAELRRHLTSGGFVTFNVNAPRPDSQLLRTFLSTVREVFPEVMVGKAGTAWNFLVLASETPLPIERMHEVSLPTGARIDVDAFLADVHPAPRDPHVRPFTDDWAPLEVMTDIEIFDAIRTLVR